MSRGQKKRREMRSGMRSHPHGGMGAAPAQRKHRRRRRGNNILWYLLILVFMVTTTIVLTTTVFFKIKNITVTGNEHYDDRSIILSSGILLEENMFRLKDQQIGDKLVEEYDFITARRGMGLMQGLVSTKPVGTIASEALKEGLIIITAGADVIRMVPPLVIEKEHVDEMITKLKNVLDRM